VVTTRYPWKRFWVPREGIVRLDNNGYMIDPEGSGHYMNPDVVPFDAISHIPCLALLGEPGIGKTFALQDIASRSERKEGTSVLVIDLRSYSDQGLLHRAIFESAEVLSWVNSTDTLEIILDSLDECMVHIRTVASMLADEFKKYPRSRLRLRLACRTAEWPRLLDEELPELWGQENCGVFELVPLRRCDVGAAAECRGLPAEDFLRAVEDKDVVPLAVKPVTLEMLLGLFEASADLAGDQSELYGRGCLELCRDPSMSREAAGAGGGLTMRERMAIAARIAALTVFCKRVSIYVGSNENEATSYELRISDIIGGEEPHEDDTVPVNDVNVREVLYHTQLFSGSGIDRLAWAHWTYAEYLAAVYLAKHELRQAQVCDLLLHPASRDRERVVPQLAETAAWFAAMQNWFLNIVAEEDPQVFLRSAVVRADDSQKQCLTAALLRLTDEGQLSDAEMELRPRYGILRHASLADQLSPYIADKSKDRMVRRVAVDIAESSHVTELVPQLLDIALDRSEDPHIRAQAAHAVAEIGSEAEKSKLKAILSCPGEEDPADDLKGNALKALWPDCLSAEEAFAAITAPRDPDYFGMYAAFLDFELAEGLQVADLPVALEWVCHQPPDKELPFAFRRLLSNILRFAWRHLDDPQVLECFIKNAMARLKSYDTILGPEGPEESLELVKQDEDTRRNLVANIMQEPGMSSDDASLLAWSRPPLVFGSDFVWVLDKLKGAPEETVEKWGTLASRLFDWRNKAHVNAVIERRDDTEAVKHVFADWLEPVELDSPQAVEQRSKYRRYQAIQQEREEKTPGLPKPFDEILLEWLEKFEAGDIGAWWRLNLDMTVDPARGVYQLNEELQPDLRALPGWEAMNADMRARTLDAAAKYLELGEPHTDEWLRTNNVHRPAFAGYRAARLLLAERSDVLERLSDEVWQKWAPIVVAFPEPIGIDDAEPMETLVQIAYARAPKQVTETLLTLIDKENEESRGLHILHKFARCWDSKLSEVLLTKAKQDLSLRTPSVGIILERVLAHDGADALSYAMSLVKCDSESERSKELAQEAAIALLKHYPAEGWSVIWERMCRAPDWGKGLFKCYAHQHDRMHTAELGNRLPPHKVAALYVWLYRQFPPEQDPDRRSTHWVGDRESVAIYRDTLITRLRERGAVAAIRRIRTEVPEADWLKYAEIAAEKTRLWRSWEGISPSALRKIIEDADSRLVESGDQLLQVLSDSLKRLEAELQGAPPAVRDLWNTRGALTPKNEEDLSDYIARHLRRDLTDRGIVANREVQIRPIEKTDIKVDALRGKNQTASGGVVSVILEVKGCWNPELTTAMETQLKNRYMAENDCTHGLYVVGWFLSDQWDKSDYRKAKVPSWSLREARDCFEHQARELSDDAAQIRAFVLNASFR